MGREQQVGEDWSAGPAASDVPSFMIPDHPDSVIDLRHLRRYTLGDSALEQEILMLFADHASATLSLLQSAVDERARQQGAHALKGSALAVGAWRIVRLAQAAETSAPDPGAVADLAAELAEAIAEARKFISAHRRLCR